MWPDCTAQMHGGTAIWPLRGARSLWDTITNKSALLSEYNIKQKLFIIKIKLNQYCFTLYLLMAYSSESDYRLLPSFIALSISVLNQKNYDLNSFGQAIAFAFHLTDWKCCWSFSACNNRFTQHKWNNLKYPVLLNKIFGFEYKLYMKINLFSYGN